MIRQHRWDLTVRPALSKRSIKVMGTTATSVNAIWGLGRSSQAWLRGASSERLQDAVRSGSRRVWVADRLAGRVTLIDEERDLVMRARAGDRNALGKILLRYSDRLLRAVLLPKLLSMASAEDALSETVSRVVEHIGRF